jgi:hypothetical protein
LYRKFINLKNSLSDFLKKTNVNTLAFNSSLEIKNNTQKIYSIYFFIEKILIEIDFSKITDSNIEKYEKLYSFFLKKINTLLDSINSINIDSTCEDL